jgi:hypothetical protein
MVTKHLIPEPDCMLAGLAQAELDQKETSNELDKKNRNRNYCCAYRAWRTPLWKAVFKLQVRYFHFDRSSEGRTSTNASECCRSGQAYISARIAAAMNEPSFVPQFLNTLLQCKSQ